MKKLYSTLSVTVLTLFTHGLALNAETNWKHLNSKDGINVFAKQNSSSEKIVTIKADTTLSQPMYAILEVVNDVPKAKEWAPWVSDKKILKRISKYETIDLTVADLPWPLKDRYYVTKQIYKELADGGIIFTSETIDYPYTIKGAIKGTIEHSVFYLTPSSPFETKISFELNLDPAGAIPKWVANLAQKQWPHDFYQALKKELVRRGQNANLAH